VGAVQDALGGAYRHSWLLELSEYLSRCSARMAAWCHFPVLPGLSSSGAVLGVPAAVP
jgi:hypothetical protein